MSQNDPPNPPPAEALSPLKRAFLALEQAQTRIATLEQAAREPIAIIGIGCRVPGADDPAAFWQLMKDERDVVGPIPASRWDVEAHYDPDPATPGRIATRSGGFLRTIDEFDPELFGIAPREAQGMDPQQRLFLEVAWEALENAGQAPDRLERSKTGVYVGVCNSDYTHLQLKTGDPDLLDAHFTSGIAHSIASGRVSYLLGLQGPSLTIDTACSSSLVAVHLACQALRSGDCRMALAGGVNLILSPEMYIALSQSRMLAPDGRCKTFSASADGFGRGEGCGVAVLKRLSDARADGDTILAVIRGTAVNQDGPSGGLTAPNGPAQEAVIREALAHAGIAAGDVGFVEAHGTGTELGDPLEVQALGSVFAERAASEPLLIGSVKTNIGHLESAAGITGLIKVVLSLRHRQVPAHLHFETPSPHIPWADFSLRVPTKLTPWEPIRGRRIGGVSSFGFSGTNAHVVLEEAPTVTVPTAPQRSTHLFTLSAWDARSLAELAARHAAALEGRSDDELADICFTANTGRARFAERAVIVATSIAELRARLQSLANGAPTAGVKVGRAESRDPLKIAFVFTGQGAQYAGMAKGLYAAAPVFRAALDRCAELVAPHLEEPLLDVIFSDATPSLVDRTAYTQPALFAVEYALAELWRSWGITPNAVIGHSVGEYVAACLAGVLELPDALRLIATRGRLMQSLPAGGGMAAVYAPEDRVAAVVASFAHVSIAAVNSPQQTVIAGSIPEVEQVCAKLVESGVRCKALKVSHAFHSLLVDPVLDAFEAEVRKVRLLPPRIRVISNLTGRIAEASDVTTPTYWRRHVREAVRFGDGLTALAAMKLDCIVEIGPHPTLLPFVNSALGDDVLGLWCLRRGKPDWEQMLDALGSLFLAGADVNLRTLADGRVTDLPTYPFQRQRYWFKAKAKTRSRVRHDDHPLLGARLRTASADAIFENAVSADSPSWVSSHRVLDHVVLPATAYLETLLAAARAVHRSDLVQVEAVTVKEAMLLDDDTQRTVQVICAPAQDGVVAATIHSLGENADDGDTWTSHVTASLRLGAPPASNEPSLASVRERCNAIVTADEHYAGFERRGLAFGTDFRTVCSLWRAEGEALGEIALTEGLARDVAHYRMHPVLLDGCVQVLDAALASGAASEALYLPIGIGRFTLYGAAGARCFGHVVVRAGGDETRTADVRVFDTEGKLVAELAEVQLKRASRDALERMGERWLDECLYETTWRAAPLAASSANAPSTLATAANEKLAALRTASGMDAYDGFHEHLESLCGAYVVHALRRLGWAPVAGESVDANALAKRLAVEPRHGQLFARLLAILAEDGWLSREDQGFRVTRALVGDAPDHASVIAKCPPAADEVELTAQLGAKLAEALKGEVDPMELLFGDPSRFERIYRDTPTARLWNGLMAEALANARANAQRPLRILEVGGGTGATTGHVLPCLQGVEYTFTDVGPLFVARARERFGTANPSMRFQTFDLERAPQTQGLDKHSFDVVIASNVIHATKDLRATLAKIHDLLVPGGLLAMLEVTAPQRWFDLTVGFTEGWWAFRDRDLRNDYATLPRDRWLSLLAENGFDSAAAVPNAPQRGVLALQSMFLARAARRAADWVLFADHGGTMSTLATKLRERGDRVTLVSTAASFAVTGDEAAIDGSLDHVKRLLAELRALGRSIRGVVHASLDTKLDEADGLRAVTSGLAVAQALVGEEEPPQLWLVTRGGQQAAAQETALVPSRATLWGLGKAIGLEHPELRCVCIDVEEEVDVDALLAELDARESEREVALRSGGRKVARLTRTPRARSTGASRPSTYRLGTTTPGALDGLGLQPLERRAPGSGEIEIAVEATGLNFKDTLNVLGMYPGDPGPLGGECAGKVTAVGPNVTQLQVGDDVLAVAGGSFASHVIARADFAQRRPRGMSAEEGASIPIAFLTAEFCLNHLAKMKKGDRVLIHAAAGGVGMAAVRLGQRAGAEIFATAGAPWKRELLRDMGVPHVLDSRSTSFADEIMARTAGDGVDIVLNSLADELIDASFRVLARGGRFVEMGKRGIKTPEWVTAQKRELQYFIVDWGETAERDPALIAGMLARLMADVGSLTTTPLPRHVFPLDEAERAFRFMAQARHAGKVIVTHASQTGIPNVRRDGTYVVTGGLAGIGLIVARWLAARGAGRIALVSRRGVTDAVAPILEELRRQGSTVVAEAIDVADESALRAFLERLRREGPPIRGVIHGAGVLDNAALIRQDASTFAHVFAPKVRGALLLDGLTRTDPLDSFVLFSSVAAVLGARGQANHSAANAFLDLLARERQTRGLPGLSINWGAWTETGAAADPEVTARLAAQGLGMLKPAQGIAALERLLGASAPQAAVLPIDWQRYLQAQPPSPFFSELAGKALAARVAPAATKTSSPRFDLQKELAAVPPGRWRPMVTAFVRERALKTLGLDPARAIDPRTPLGDLGLDSLLAVELRNTLSGAFGKPLPATLLFDYPTIEKLSEHVLGSILGVAKETEVQVPETTITDAPKGEALVDSIEELSDEEVERRLAARGARVAGSDGRDEDVR